MSSSSFLSRSLHSHSERSRAMSNTNPSLQFLPLSTSISPSFWHALTSIKLHQLKLSQDPIPVYGHYSKGKQVRDRLNGNELVGISSGLELDQDSFSNDEEGEQVGKSSKR